MATEWQEAIGAACYRLVMVSPHIIYGTTFDRFGVVVPPQPRHMDCSGATGTAYWSAARIRIGGDTGAIARDVAAGRAVWVNTNNIQPGDLVMRRSGPVYNGGPDEHVGIHMYRLPDGRGVTFESAGSKNGVGYYPRQGNFWRDGVRYKATGTPQLPTEIEMPGEHHFLVKGDKVNATFLTDGFVIKRPTFDVGEEAAIRQSGILANEGKVVIWPQLYVDRIPTVTDQ